MDVDDVHRGGLDNFDNVRGLTKHLANNSSLDIMSITNSLVNYAEHMERNNDFVDEVIEHINNS